MMIIIMIMILIMMMRIKLARLSLTPCVCFQVPVLMRETLEELSREHRGGAQFDLAFDAGCGMGACGQQIRNITRTLVGADSETKMVEKVRFTSAWQAFTEAPEIHISWCYTLHRC